MNKKVLAAVLGVGAIISVATLSASAVNAEETAGRPQTIISRLSEKFNLNQDEVEAVFDAVHEEHMAQMQQMHQERLDQAVADGVITEDQKNALTAKREEMQTEREQNREEMQAWLSENGIDEEALREYMGFGDHRMHGMGPRSN